MLERLKKIIERIDELTLRERGVILAAMLTLLFLGWYAYLVEPLKLTERTLLSELDRKRTQLQTLNEQFTLLVEQQQKDPRATARKRLQQLREEQKQLTAELRSATANLVAPELMPEVLRSMLKSADGLSLVSLKGTGSTPLIQPAAGVAPAKGAKPAAAAKRTPPAPKPAGPLDAAYRHGVQMEFTGDFYATLAFLQRLEALEWKFFWESVSFDVGEYPQAKATLRVFTLSLDKNWIGT
jgi:MSHA biogenesis protein MshJ